MNINDLIAQLSASTNTISHKEEQKTTFINPNIYLKKLAVTLIIYLTFVQFFLGIRADLLKQLQQPFFALEIVLLLSIIVTGIYNVIQSMYPQRIWKRKSIIYVPHTLAILFFVLMMGQLTSEFINQNMILNINNSVNNPLNNHALLCTVCITCTAMLPSLFLFLTLKKGAIITPRFSGSISILVATAIGCLTLRLAENTSSITHLVLWHYVPSLFFSLFGVYLGTTFLKW
jgi:hypothetical protein